MWIFFLDINRWVAKFLMWSDLHCVIIACQWALHLKGTSIDLEYTKKGTSIDSEYTLFLSVTIVVVSDYQGCQLWDFGRSETL